MGNILSNDGRILIDIDYTNILKIKLREKLTIDLIHKCNGYLIVKITVTI